MFKYNTNHITKLFFNQKSMFVQVSFITIVGNYPLYIIKK